MRRLAVLIVVATALVATPAAHAASLSVGDAAVPENASPTTTIPFTITLSEAAPAGGVTVKYSTANGTGAHPAVAPGDYTAVTNATATIDAGQTTATVHITTNPDNTCEFDEGFRLQLSEPSGGVTLGDADAVGTLTNDDGLCLFVDDPTVEETTGVNTTVEFKVTLNGAVPPGGFTVNYAASSGPPLTPIAAQTSDYTATASTPPPNCAPNCPLAFAEGDSPTKTVSVPIVGDSTDEHDERFRLTLSNIVPSSITFGKVTGIATITDDDDPPSVSIADGVLNKPVSDGSGSVLHFAVSLSAASGKTVYVDYETQDITAQANVDYTPVRGLLTFEPGQIRKEQAVTVTALGDSLDIDRTFRVGLSLRSHLSSFKARFTNADLNKPITIDGQPRTIMHVVPPAFTGDKSNVTLDTPLAKAGAVPFKLTRTFGDGEVQAFAGGTHDTLESNTAFFDEQLDTNNKPVTFGVPPNEITTTIVGWLNDHTVKIPAGVVPHGEGKTFRYSQDFTDGTLQGGGDELTLGDGEAIGLIKSVGPVAKIEGVTVDEGAAGTTRQAELSVTLDSPAPQPLSLAYTTSDGSAKAPADYEAVPAAANARVSFAAGETTKTISITINGNDTHDADKTFGVVLADPVDVQLPSGNKTGIVTIRNDDGVPAIQVSDLTVPEPKGTVTNVTIPVRLNGTSTTTLTAAYATGDESAVAGVNYQQTTGNVTFKPGETEQKITVPITGDGVVTDDLRFTVTIADTSPGSPPVVVTVTLADSDLTAASAPQISVNDATSRRTATSAPATVFTVRLDRPLTRTVSVDYSTESGSAVAGRDFAPRSGRLTIPPGQIVAAVEVPVLINPAQRSNVSFGFVLSNPASATIGRSRGVGVVINADNPALPFSSPSRLRASSFLCRRARGCRGVPASWTVTEAGRVRIQITAKVKAKGKKGKTRTVVLARTTRTVRRGKGRTRVRRVSRRGSPRMLRMLRRAKVSSVQVSLTFTTRLGEQSRAVRSARLIR